MPNPDRIAIIRANNARKAGDPNRADCITLLVYCDEVEVRQAALVTAGDALCEALRLFVHAGTGDAKLIAWKRVAECRAAWRKTREATDGY